MKLLNSLTILLKNTIAKKSRDEAYYIRQIYWEKECKDNPTRQYCLIYCD